MARTYYSVPYTFIGWEVDVSFTSSRIEIYHKGKRVASHLRIAKPGAYVTEPLHLPHDHKRYLEWTPAWIASWGEKIGPHTWTLMEEIMERRDHPEHGLGNCLGLIRLAKLYTPERVEQACRRALEMEKLLAVKLHGMAEGLRDQMNSQAYRDLGFEERSGVLVDKEKLFRENRQVKILAAQAHFRHPSACFENIDFRARRGITKDGLLGLCQNGWIRNRHNLILVGPTGVGKNVHSLCPGHERRTAGTQRPVCAASPVNGADADRPRRRQLSEASATAPEDEGAHRRRLGNQPLYRPGKEEPP